MSKLFIHIGFHKTGSTSLQFSLNQNQDILKKNGFSFLAGNKSGNSSDFISVNLNQSSARVTVTDKFYSLLDKNDGEDGIISAEHLSLIEDKNEIEKLYRKAREKYDDVIVVAYLRKQHKLAMSFKQQAAKQPHLGAAPSSQLCGHDFDSPLPPLTYTLANYLDFYTKYQLWESIFGKDNVIFRVYDKKFLHDECICKDFSKLINLSQPLPSLNVNESFGILKTQIKHFLIQTKAPIEIINYFNGLKIVDSEFELVSKPIDYCSYTKFFQENNKKLPLNKDEIESLNFLEKDKYLVSDRSICEVISTLLINSNVDKTLVDCYINVASRY